MNPVVGAVYDDGIVSNAEVIQFFQELPDLSVWVGGAAFISENEDWDASELLNPADILGEARAAGSADDAGNSR